MAALRIFKYELEIADVQVIHVPIGANFIAVQMQRGVLCAWAIVSPDSKPTKRQIHIVGTGHPFDGRNLQYLGTAQTDTGLVWHVFDAGDVYWSPPSS